jgi:hypothetical protein
LIKAVMLDILGGTSISNNRQGRGRILVPLRQRPGSHLLPLALLLLLPHELPLLQQLMLAAACNR